MSAPGALAQGAAAIPAPPLRARRWGGRRAWALAAVVVVLALVGLEVLGRVFGPGPQGPVSSSYATNDQGLAAWSELAARGGDPVVALRQPLSDATLDPASTVVVLDPDALLRADGQRMLAFVRRGGRLIVGGQDPDATLTALYPAPPGWTGSSAPLSRPTRAAATELPGVATVQGAGAGAWTQTDGARVLLADSNGDPVLMTQRLGAGEILLLADASPLQNAYLAQADNAQLALVLAGGARAGAAARRSLVFAESVHGYGPNRGFAALPAGFKVALWGLAVAGLLWILARGRRLGPPDSLPEHEVPARTAYVRALMLLLRRAGPPRELVPTLRRAAERELAARPSTGAAASAVSRRRALAQLGLDEVEVDALTGDGDADPVRLGSALAHLRSRR